MSAMQNAEAEARTVGCLLLHDDALSLVADSLRPEDFAIPPFRAAYEAVLSVRASGRAIDPLTVQDELGRAGRGTMLAAAGTDLLALADAASIWHNVREWAAMVARDGARRRVVSVCQQISQRVTDGGDEVADVLADARRDFADIEAGAGGGPESLATALPGALDAIEARRSAPEANDVTTGLREFDEKIGPTRAGQLVVVGARPGVGKTAWAVTVALHAARRGVPVLIFTLEMTRNEMIERLAGADARLCVSDLARGRVTREAFRALYGANVGRLPISIDDRVLTMGQIASVARAWRARNRGLRALVVIDYVGLVRPPAGKREMRSTEVGQMAWGAKVLAKDAACPVMMLSQLNRAMEDGAEPSLTNLRESGEIEQHAHMVVFPHRDMSVAPEPGASQSAHIIVAKNRGGPVGRIPCWWHGKYMTFENSERGDNEQSERFSAHRGTD